MAVDMIIFAIMAYFYKSIIKPSENPVEVSPEKNGSFSLHSGKSNEGYVNDANSKMWIFRD